MIQSTDIHVPDMLHQPLMTITAETDGMSTLLQLRQEGQTVRFYGSPDTLLDMVRAMETRLMCAMDAQKRAVPALSQVCPVPPFPSIQYVDEWNPNA